MNAPLENKPYAGTTENAHNALEGAPPGSHTNGTGQAQQQAPAQASEGALPPSVTNTAFVQAIFGTLPEGRGIAVTHFKDVAKPNWKGLCWAEVVCPDYPDANAYYCPSSLTGGARKLEFFAALHVVVLDDVKATTSLPAPTYAIETSEGNYQLGYKLSEPLTDKEMARQIHSALEAGNYCDKNGNNPVRWIRLPVGMNTKPGKMFKHRLVTWEPERTFTVEQLMEQLRLQVGQAPAQAPTQQPATPQAEQTVTLPERFNQKLTPEQITHLRSALNAIDPDAYDYWALMGLALKPYGIVGKELWLTFGMRSEKYDPRKAEKKWNEDFNDTDSTYGMVFTIAEKNGWLNPLKNAARDPNAPPTPIPEWVVGGFREVLNKWQAERQQASPDPEKGADLLSKLRKKSATNNLEELKMKAETEVLVFGEIGSLGQFISLHAFPNKGKTLITLYWVLQAIEKDIVKGENVFFLNFDDNANGFIDKTEIANELGFNMLGPNQTSVEEMSEILAGLCDNDVASGTVFIFDTLKKFVNVMNKEKQSEFYKLLRRYVMSGGTVLTLGHCNKNPDENGKPVVAGTQDISDDVDALYVIDVVEGANSTVVEIEKRKNRGMGVEVAYYTFGNVHKLESEDAEGKHVNRYRALLNTVMPLADSKASISKGMMDRQQSIQKYSHVIDAIRVAISAGIGHQMQIVEAVNTAHGHGKNLIRKVLSAHTWTSTDNYVAGAGFLWFCVQGPNNSKNYTLTQG